MPKKTKPETQYSDVSHATLNGLNDILSEEAGEKVFDQKLPQEFPDEEETVEAQPIDPAVEDAIATLREGGFRTPSRGEVYDIYRKFDLLVAGATAEDVIRYASEWVG